MSPLNSTNVLRAYLETAVAQVAVVNLMCSRRDFRSAREYLRRAERCMKTATVYVESYVARKQRSRSAPVVEPIANIVEHPDGYFYLDLEEARTSPVGFYLTEEEAEWAAYINGWKTDVNEIDRFARSEDTEEREYVECSSLLNKKL